MILQMMILHKMCHVTLLLKFFKIIKSLLDISFDTKVCFILNALIIWLIKSHIIKLFFSNCLFSIEIFSVVASEKKPFVYSQ